MATVQDVLDRMEVLDRELQLQSSEADVTKGLVAVNMAQDHFEAIVAQYPGLLGDQSNTVTTSANTETTTYPAELLRLDSMWYEDSNGDAQWRLRPLYGSGMHRGAYNDPIYNLLRATTNTGKPLGYWTDGTNIYWAPEPNGTHTVRWYGFQAAGDYTAAGDTFAYPLICRGPFAAFATRMFEFGLDDPEKHYESLAQELFGPVIETLTNFRREGARPVRLAGEYDMYY